MNRKIEFRGKSKKDNEWHYGSLFIDDNYGGGYDYYIDYMLYGSLPYRHSERVIGDSVGQYIGLKDKNKKEIFEGDIIKYFDEPPLGIVYYNDSLGAFMIDWKFEYEPNYFNDCDIDQIEVIGNIYDNPELLEVE